MDIIDNIKEAVKAVTFTVKIFVIPIVALFILFCICGVAGMYNREHRPVSEIVDPNAHGVLFTEDGHWVYEDNAENN